MYRLCVYFHYCIENVCYYCEYDLLNREESFLFKRLPKSQQATQSKHTNSNPVFRYIEMSRPKLMVVLKEVISLIV